MSAPSKTLAGLILLLRSDVTPEQAKEAADLTLKRLDALYDADPAGPTRVTDDVFCARIREAIASSPHLPAMRELLVKVRGGRDRIHKIAKQMISRGEIEVVRSGRQVGLKLTNTVK